MDQMLENKKIWLTNEWIFGGVYLHWTYDLSNTEFWKGVWILSVSCNVNNGFSRNFSCLQIFVSLADLVEGVMLGDWSEGEGSPGQKVDDFWGVDSGFGPITSNDGDFPPDQSGDVDLSLGAQRSDSNHDGLAPVTHWHDGLVEGDGVTKDLKGNINATWKRKSQQSLV